MKKFLTFVLVLAMVLSVSSFAMAAGAATVTNDTDLLAAIQDPSITTITIDGDLTYDWGGDSYANSKALLMAGKTIVGKDGNDSITFKGYGSANPITNVTLKNITIKDETVGDDEGSWEHGYLEFNNLTAEGVTFCDIQLNGTCSLKKCTFDNTKSSWYAAWVNSGSATFEECYFTGTRGLKVHEAYGSDVDNVVVDGCTFDGLTEKPGIAIGTLDDQTIVKIKDSNFMNCQPGDNGKYIYESDTDISTFTFELEDNNVTAPTTKPSSGNGISVKYNGGNSFSTSKSDVPTGVEIDGVPVTFNGTGSNFTVGCISSDAKWVTVRWNSTSVTTNFTPDGLVECTTVSIPKTGDMSIWAAIAQFLGF